MEPREREREDSIRENPRERVSYDQDRDNRSGKEVYQGIAYD